MAGHAVEIEKCLIEAKKAENNPVDEMTVKNLRKKVAKWKADYEHKKSEVENLFVEQSSLQATVQTMQKNFDKLTSQKNSLQEQLKNQKPIEKFPDDYERDKKELADVKTKLAETAKRTEIFQKIDTVCLL